MVNRLPVVLEREVSINTPDFAPCPSNQLIGDWLPAYLSVLVSDLRAKTG